MATRSTWPSQPEGFGQDSQDDVSDSTPTDRAQDEDHAYLVIAEMAGLLRETRHEITRAAGVLAAITIGMALEARFAARMLQPGIFRAVNVGLLFGLLCCLLIATVMLTVANRPTIYALNELRWVTGAPLDTRARWLTLPPVGADPDQWTWIRAHLLVGAARLARERAHRADTWTYLTAAYFLVWTAVIAIGG